MTHPADDDYESNEPFSSPCSAPPIEPIGDEPVQEDAPNVPPNPANENVAMPAPAPRPEIVKDFERHAEDSFRMAAGKNAETVEGLYATATEAYGSASEAFRATAEGFATAFTQLNWKLLEFSRINAQANLDFARSISGARSMRDLVDAQTAYMRGQYDALTSQMRELQSLTTELAGKTAAPLKDQFTRAAQLPRIC